jgi:hypothetical protein
VVGVKRISFNFRFVNEAENDLVPGKIHTIRRNYDFWKGFEGQDVALFAWEGKPYRSKQRVFCVKRLVSVQRVIIQRVKTTEGVKMPPAFYIEKPGYFHYLRETILAINDGFEDEDEFVDWFYNYPDWGMGILHFTDFKY